MKPQIQTNNPVPALPDNPEDQLRGFQALYQNPYYLSLLVSLAEEETAATDRVFNDNLDTNTHFKEVGRALGLVRAKDLHIGKIEDLKTKINENDNDAITKS